LAIGHDIAGRRHISETSGSIWRLECEMTAPVAIERAFALFQDPYNLAKVTPAWLSFQIVTR
jgi:hypothetical protein